MKRAKKRFDVDIVLISIILTAFVFYDLFFYGKFLPSFLSYLILTFFLFLILIKIKPNFALKLGNKTFIVIILFLTIFIFSKSSIFDFSGPVIVTDHPFIFGTSYFDLKALQSGNPNYFVFQFNFVPKLNRYFQSFLIAFHNFIFNIDLVILSRISIIISFLVCVFGIYYYTKLKFGPNSAFITSVMFISFIHHQFITGNVNLYIAVGVSFFVFYFYERFKSQKLILPFFMIILWAHPIIFLISLAIYLIIWVTESNKSFNGLLTPIFSFVLLLLYSFSTNVFSNISNEGLIYSYVPYLSSIYEIFFKFFIRHSFAVLIIGSFGLVLLRDNRWSLIFLFLISSIFIDQYIIYPLQIYISFFIRVFLCVFTGAFLVKFFKRGRNKLLTSLIISLLLVDVVFYQIYLFQVWSNPNNPIFEYVNGGNFYDWEKINLTQGIFSFQPNPHLSETIELINDFTGNESRILFEDSVYCEWGGYVSILLGVYTDRLFIGGPYVSLFPKKDSAYDSIIFGRHINEYTIDEFRYYLDVFNIRFIFAWTQDFKEFLDTYHENFVFVTNTSDGFANMYEYSQATESFVILDKGEASLTFGNNIINVDLKGVIAGERMILSFVWYPNWQGLYDDGPLNISREESTGVIEVILPKSGDYSIELKFL